MENRVAVIIPSWQGRSLLEECLPALFASTVAVDVIVVDNGSTDGTDGWLSQFTPNICVIKNNRNVGFAAAVNQGIRASNSEWLALLNNDAIPEFTWLEKLLAVGSTDPRIGAVASRMMFRDTPSIVSSLGIRVDPSGGAWDLQLGETTWPSEPVDVFGASGGACLYRRTMLDDVGLLDEHFFAYLEDVDLAWRARWRGWNARLSPDAIVYHALSATSGEGSAFKRYHLARNKWRVIVKNYPRELLIKNCLAIAAYDVLSVGRSLATGDTAASRGRIAAALDLPLLLRQRRAIRLRRRVDWTSIEAALSPLESPAQLFRRGRRATRLAHPAATPDA